MKKIYFIDYFLSSVKYSLPLFLALTLTRCTLHIQSESNVEGYNYNENIKVHQGGINFEILKRRYHEEWELNRDEENHDGPPMLGLAMSGGGMRSASFNVGILKGLHKIGLLNKVDIMSSVSGGSYAMSWYYLQKYNSGESDDVIFDPEGRFFSHLRENGRIVTHSTKAMVTVPEYMIKLGTNIVATPFHLLSNGLFDWKLNTAPYRWFYQNAIEREFHLTPGRDGKLENGSSFLGLTVGVDKEVHFKEMREFLKEKKLPTFVINTTASISDNMDHLGAEFRNTIFEFTPFTFGSDAYGYKDSKDSPVDIHTAVAISGAAADSSILPEKIKPMFSMLNLDLGYYIPNYNISNNNKVVKHNLLPVPFYFFYRSNNDLRGTRIYLSDGGHSENLGAFSLIRRLCRKIIIVDAEFDPQYRFVAYYKLKAQLKKELGVDLSLPDIDKEIFSINFDEAKSIYDMNFPEKLREVLGFENDVKVSYDDETYTWQLTERKADSKIYRARRQGNKLNIYKVFDGSKPVMKGTVSFFPIEEDGIFKEVALGVIYIKLSLDLKNLDTYPSTVTKYYKAKKGWFRELIGYQNTPFPHEETSDISYGASQFDAYHDLGFHFVTQFLSQQDKP